MNLTRTMNTKLAVVLIFLACHTFRAVSTEKTALTVLENEGNGDSEDAVSEVSFVDPNAEEFIPTHEWQEVKKGQPIPAGLHVRLNLQTGKNEAKLLDGDNNKNKADKIESKPLISDDVNGQNNLEESRLRRLKEAMEQAMKDIKEDDDNVETEEGTDKNDVKYWKDGDQQGMVNLGKDHFTKEELKNALKKFKANKDDVQNKETVDIKNKFRSMEELKKDFEKANMGIKTDLEILQELHKAYQKESITLENKLLLLEDMEYYVHQIDNALNFVDIGSLQLVLKDLNDTNELVRSAAAFVIGSAVQSNPKVQVKAIESGALHQLIRMISSETSTKVHKRVMYAISSLIRHFPFAQQKFIEQGGFQALGDIFMKSDNENLKVKVVTLLGDLVHEHKSVHTRKDIMKDQAFQQTLMQYNMIPLFEFISEHGWCNLVPSLLSLPDHDQKEKTLVSMKELLPICKEYYSTVQNQLLVLKTEYTTLAQNEENDDSGDIFFSTVAETISHILNEMSVRDEL